jgi:hypothetical protein
LKTRFKHNKGLNAVFLGALFILPFVLTNCVNSGCKKQFFTITQIEQAELTYIHYPDSIADTLNTSNDAGILIYYNTEDYDSVSVTEKAIKHDCSETVNPPDSIRVYRIDSTGNEIDYSSSFVYYSMGNSILNPFVSYTLDSENPVVSLVYLAVGDSDKYVFRVKHFKRGEVVFTSITNSAYLLRE